MPTPTIRVIPSKCLGCGSCVATFPEIFELYDDGSGGMVVRIKSDADLSKLTPEDYERIKTICPSMAIEVVDEEAADAQ